MSYTFIDASGNTQTADSSVISGTTQRPIIQIGSILGTIPTTLTGTVVASIVSTTPSSVQVGASVMGTVPITQAGPLVISGSVLSVAAPVASLVSGISSVITSTSATSVLAAAPGGQRNYISTILVTNQQSSVTGAGTQVSLIDDGSGQVIWAGYAAAGGGGFANAFSPALKQPTSAFSVSAKAASQASVIVGISGYTA